MATTTAQNGKRARDCGLLLLRVGMFALIWNFHMARKLGNISAELHEFPDPLGVGHALSFMLAVGSEGLCSLLVAFGLATRLAALPIIFTMAMVLLLGAQGFEGADVQSALLYALPYAALVLTGPGGWSLDQRLTPYYRKWLEKLNARARAQSHA